MFGNLPALRLSTLSIGIIGVVLVGCNQSNPYNGSSDTVPEIAAAVSRPDVLDVVQPDEQVLATVNGSRIGSNDLAVNLVRTLGDNYQLIADAGIEDTMLESMIASRAIAMSAMDSMSDDEIAAIEKRVALFREELLVKDFLLNNAEPVGITSEQVAEYYENNPQEFSGKQERLYELVTVSPDDYKRDMAKALQSVSLAKTSDDWRQLSRESIKDDSQFGIAHSYKTLTGSERSSEIESAVLEMKEGKVSRLIISDGAPYLVRLLKVSNQDAIPLEQARADIKRKLLPASVRKSVKALSAQALEKADVVITASAE